MNLRHGDHGYRVTSLQNDLVLAGYAIAVDGWFGDATEFVVRAEQRSHGLVVDGIVGPKTRAAIQGRPLPKTLKQRDLASAAHEIGIPLAAMLAVNEVESRGRGFLTSGEPVILFERHVMRRRLRAHGIDPQPIARRHPDIVNRDPGGYIGGMREHDRLARAKDIHIPSAIESCSWGLFQIMGFHWQRLGYTSAAVFEAAMHESERNQLEAFVRFIEADAGLLTALRNHDWSRFARGYNGPAFRRNDYDTKLAAAYRRHQAALEEDRAA